MQALKNQYQSNIDSLKKRAGIDFANDREFILKWLETYNEYIEDYYLSGKMYEFPEEQKIILSYPLFNPKWNWRVHKNLISKLQLLEVDQIKQVIGRIQRMACGNFSHLKRVNEDRKKREYMTEYFYEKDTLEGKTMLILVGIERVPTLERNRMKVEKFDFNQYIMFLNLNDASDKVTLSSISEKYTDLLKDLGRTGFVVEPIPQKPEGNDCFLFQKVFEEEGEGDFLKRLEVEDIKNSRELRYQPCLFAEYTITPSYQVLYKYSKELNRWATKASLRRIFVSNERFKIRLKNRKTIDKLADYESASNLVDLLKNITNLNVKLTEEEKNAIGKSNSAVVIGRSGTGKTTCALLRLFTFELVFRMRVRIKHQKYEKVLRDVLTHEPIGLQSVFVTTSPVLANKIQSYYRQFITNVKEEVKRKQKLKEQEEQNQVKDDDFLSKEKIENENIERLSANISNSDDVKIETNEVKNLMEDEIDEFKIPEAKENQNENIQRDEDQSAYEGDDDEFEDEQQNNKFELAEKETKYTSLKQLRSADFPAFWTVRQYLMLIEGSLLSPFFARDNEGRIVNQDGQSSWNNYKSEKQKKLMQITTQNSEQDDIAIKKFTKNNIENFAVSKKANEDIEDIDDVLPQNRRFEIDYPYFENVFWPVASIKFNSSIISCNTLWTEIYFNIKGQKDSSFMSLSQYEAQTSLLSGEQKSVIYKMFLQYEQWKAKQFGYDLMDLVLFIERQIENFNYDFPSIHLTFIDEIQDLPLKIVQIFFKMSEHSHFYGGDSAQSIARGLGFKFSDLPLSSIHQLTVNFRSHNKILDLSNSVISLLEGLFPMSIDILNKEKSNITGPKPIVLEDTDISFLFSLLQGSQNQQGFIPIDFGCNQVIIVKDDESKAKLPVLLEDAICLTIKEAKGLEFDDVILIDFFSNSSSTVNQWESVKLLDIDKKQMKKEEFLKTVTQHKIENEMSAEEMDEFTFEQTFGVGYDTEKDIVTINDIVTKSEKLRAFKHVQNSQLALELKQLYTAITRPKKKLIIFDQDSSKRQPVFSFWQELNMVTTVSSKDVENLENTDQSIENLSKKEKLMREEKNKIIQLLKQLVVKNTKEEWFEQGKKMFKHRYFEQAVKCFKKSGHTNFERKAQAYLEATTISGEIMKLDNQLSMLKYNIGIYATAKQVVKISLGDDLKKKMKEMRERFVQTGEIFLSINRKRQAAQCFFSAEQYERAATLYLELGQKKEAAEAYQLSKNNYVKAAYLYEQVQDFDQAITCLEQGNEWTMILILIQRNIHKISEKNIKSLREKYFALAFQNIKTVIEKKAEKKNVNETIEEKEESESLSSFDSDFFENDEDIEEEEGQEIQEKEDEEQSEDISLMKESHPDQHQCQKESLKNKFKDKRKFKDDEEEIGAGENEMIETQEQFESDISSIKNKLKAQMKKSKEKKNQSQNDQQLQEQDRSEIGNKKDETTSVIDVSKLNQSMNDSVSIIDKEQSNIDISDISFDNFSVLDPFDEIIKKQLSQSLQSILASDYSILDSSQINVNQRGLLIEAKDGTSITDETLKRVLEVVSLIEPSILQLLKDFISKHSETEVIENDGIYYFSSQLQGIEQIDLDNLDKNIIEKMLDTLEQQHQPLIELQICNRYKTFNRISKIIPFLSLKHSPLSFTNSSVQQNKFLLQLSAAKRRQREQSIIANTGLHTVFEQISPDYFSYISTIENQPLFTQDCFQQLILQGYWKRILYLLERRDALDVASIFSDFASYKRFAKKQELITEELVQQSIVPGFSDLPEGLIENNEEQSELAKIYMEDFNYYAINKGFSKSISEVKIPTYFKYHKAIWSKIQNQSDSASNKEDQKILLELLSDVAKVLSDKRSNHSDLQIFDIMSSFNLILLYHQQLQTFKDVPETTLQDLSTIAEKMMHFVKDYNNITDKRSQKVVQAILSAYQVRMSPEQNSGILSVFGRNQVILNKSNLLVFSLIKNYKSIDDLDTITHCDIEFEHIRAPLNVVLLLIHRRIKPLIEGISGVVISEEPSGISQNVNENIQKPQNVKDNNPNKNKVIYKDQDYYELYYSEELQSEKTSSVQIKNTVVTYKDEIFSMMNGKQQLLTYGLTEKYNELLFSSYSQLLIDELNIYLKEQILVNLVINYQENIQVKLFIPEGDTAILEVLAKNQNVLSKQDQKNKEVLALNLNSFDNIEDIDEICQVILKSVKIANRNQQRELFKLIFVILINVNDIDFQSIGDLISALKLMDWTGEVSQFLVDNEFYQELIDCQNAEEAKDFAYDFALTEEFESLFFKWEEKNILNQVIQGTNLKRYEEDLHLFKKNQSVKDEKIRIIQHFMKKNQEQLHYVYKTNFQLNDLTEFYPFKENINQENYTSSFRYVLFSLEEAANTFSLLKQIQKESIRTFYCQQYITVELFNLIQDTLKKVREIFEELSSRFAAAVNSTLETKKPFKKYRYYSEFLNIYEKVLEFYKTFREQLNHFLVKINGESVSKKKIENINLQMNPTDKKLFELKEKWKKQRKIQQAAFKKSLKNTHSSRITFFDK